MNRRIPLTAAGASLAILLTACGSSAAQSAAPAASEAPSAAAATTAPSGQAVDPNAPEVSPPGDIPDNQAFVPYTPPQGGFTVKVPEGWARSEQGGTITFTDKLNRIMISSEPAASAPTVDSAKTDEVPAIEAQAQNFSLGQVTTVQRDAGEAVQITYTADGPKDEVTGKVRPNSYERYEFYSDGTEVVLTLAGPVGADNVDPWRIVTDSFGWQA